jgi:hypothetical protein
MAVVNWGSLHKSQVDDETIEEAIARLIAAHEADETSHLGAGESLQSHKASDIIDHAALSIIEDKIAEGAITTTKITNDQIIGKDIRTAEDVGAGVDGVAVLPTGIEMWQSGDKKVDIPVSGNPTFKGNVSLKLINYLRQTIFFPLNSIDGYYTTIPTGANIYPKTISLEFVNSTTSGASLLLRAISSFAYPYYPAAPSIRFSAYFAAMSRHDTYIVCGAVNPQASVYENYFGIRTKHTEATKVYAVVRDDIDHEYEVELTGINPTSVHSYLCTCSSDGLTFDFYVDNVLITTITSDAAVDLGSASFCVDIKSAGTVSAYVLYLADIIFQQDY